jgi:hypothetical protein
LVGREAGMNAFKVILEFYSLGVGKIGQPIGKPPVVRTYDNVIDAMKDLFASIEKNEGYVSGEGMMKLIEMPDGRRLAFDSVYKEYFGVDPVKQDNRENLYPMLFGKKRRKS